MDGQPNSLHVVGPVGSTGEVGEVELDLVPAVVQLHWHGTDEGLYLGGRLVVAGSEPPLDALVVQDLDLKAEVLLHVLHQDDQEREFNAELLHLLVWTRDICRGDIAPRYLQDSAVDVIVSQSLNVPVLDVLLPDLEWLRPKRVKDRKEACLVRVFEHYIITSVFQNLY